MSATSNARRKLRRAQARTARYHVRQPPVVSASGPIARQGLDLSVEQQVTYDAARKADAHDLAAAIDAEALRLYSRHLETGRTITTHGWSNGHKDKG